MKIERIVNYYDSQNCYLVYDENGDGVLIDPGSEFERIEERVRESGVNVKGIFLTHCHYDHIRSLDEVRKKFSARVYASFECNQNIQNPSVNLSVFNDKVLKEDQCEEILTDGCITKIGNLEIKTITTPGHTDGGVCFLAEEHLFSGDTLFLRSVGRCDFPKGDIKALEKSIKTKIYTLDDDIIVHPGHGNDTKIYYEKRYNTYVRE